MSGYQGKVKPSGSQVIEPVHKGGHRPAPTVKTGGDLRGR